MPHPQNVTRLCGAVLKQLAWKENIALAGKQTPVGAGGTITIYGTKDLRNLSDYLTAATEEKPIVRKLTARRGNQVKSAITPYIQRITCGYKQNKLPRENLKGAMLQNVKLMQHEVVKGRLHDLVCEQKCGPMLGVHVAQSLLTIAERPPRKELYPRTKVLLDALRAEYDGLVSGVRCIETYAYEKWEKHGLPMEALTETPLERYMHDAYTGLDAWEPF